MPHAQPAGPRDSALRTRSGPGWPLHVLRQLPWPGAHPGRRRGARRQRRGQDRAGRRRRVPRPLLVRRRPRHRGVVGHDPRQHRARRPRGARDAGRGDRARERAGAHDPQAAAATRRGRHRRRRAVRRVPRRRAPGRTRHAHRRPPRGRPLFRHRRGAVPARPHRQRPHPVEHRRRLSRRTGDADLLVHSLLRGGERGPRLRPLLRRLVQERVRLRRQAARQRRLHGRRRRAQALRLPRPLRPRRARRVHQAHRPHAAPARVGARLPAEPLGLLPGQRAVPDHPRIPQPRHPLRRAVPRHRLHGRVPAVHLEPPALPRPAAHAGRPQAPGDEGHHHRGRRREGRQRLRRVPPAPGRERRRDLARRIALRGRRVAGQDHLPRLHAPAHADLVGRDEQPAVGRRDRGHLERHERAGQLLRRHAAGRHDVRQGRARGQPPRVPQPLRPAGGAGHLRGLAPPPARPPAVHRHPRRLLRAAALHQHLDRRQLRRLGAPGARRSR